MAVKFDISDLKNFKEKAEAEVLQEMDKVGKEAVQFAFDHGAYQNHTWKLRKSNEYEVSKQGLKLKNETEYASYVEAKGFDVLSRAALYAERRLNGEEQ